MTTTPATTQAPLPADARVHAPTAVRHSRLADKVTRLRSRASTGGLDRWMLIIGGTLMPLGVLLILLGWLGASRTVLVFEQVPYLISGGLLGTALVIAGGFVYFTYWQTLRVREARVHQKQLLEALDRLESSIALGGLDAVAAASPARPDRLVATASGTMAHRPDCPIVTGRTDLRDVTAAEDSMRACGICKP